MDLAPPAPRLPTEADARPPRPGWAKALGIAHVVTATLATVASLSSVAWLVIVLATPARPGGASLLMGMDHPRCLWFMLIEGLTGLIANALTFATGVALINLRAWGARAWDWLAPLKIARVVLIWGGFIVLVAPVMAQSAGEGVSSMIRQSAPGAKRGPTAAEMGLIYSWMFLAQGVGMIVLGSAYPAFAWWAARRRGIRAALVEGKPAADRAGWGVEP